MSLEQLLAYKKKLGESIRAFVQWCNIIKNSAEAISDERAIDALNNGLCRHEFIEELGRTKPKTILQLMDIANRWADGEDAVHKKRARSPEDDRDRRSNDERR